METIATLNYLDRWKPHPQPSRVSKRIKKSCNDKCILWGSLNKKTTGWQNRDVYKFQIPQGCKRWGRSYLFFR